MYPFNIPSTDFRKKTGNITVFLLLLLPILAYSNPQTLTCPPLVNLQLDICEDEIAMDWTEVSWNSDVQVMTVIFDPPQGTLLSEGTYNGNISIIDINNQSADCNIQLKVVQPTHFLGCVDTVTVSLANNCTPVLSPNTVSPVPPVVCPDEVNIKLIDQFGTTVVQGPAITLNVGFINKTYNYIISDLITGFNCQGVLQVVGPSNFSLVCPSAQIIFCNEDFNSELLGMPIPVSCYSPAQISFQHFDENYSFDCPNDKNWEVVRTWVATNPLGETSNCTHSIIGKRFSVTQISFPPDFDDIEEPAILCEHGTDPTMTADTSITGYPTVGNIPIFDESCDVEVSFTDSVFQICGASVEIRRYWSVVDSCVNESRIHKQTIIIRDYSEPVYEIPDTVYANVSSGCSKFVPMPSITLLDECSDVFVRIATPFDTLMGNGGDLKVLFIPGYYSCRYEVTDACGNAHFEPFILALETGALLKCPEDRSVSTNFWADNVEEAFLAGDTSALNFFGKAINYVNCLVPYETTAELEIDSCGNGEILRTFVGQGQGLECEQIIEIEHISDFAVTFPSDITIECEDNEPFEAGDPTVFFADWENISVEYEDEVFDIVPGYCLRILRTWTVKNECISNELNGNSTPETSEFDLHFMFDECDLSGNDTCDIFTFKDGLNDFNYPNANPDGWMEYIQIIRIEDNINPDLICSDTIEFCITDSSCNTDISLELPDYQDCTDMSILEIVADIPGLNQSNLNAFDVPAGHYSVQFSAFDMCGNGDMCESLVIVKDCVLPTAFCSNNFTASITDANSVTVSVSANQLNLGSIDNCNFDLGFSFSANPTDTVMVFDCDHIGTNSVELWVTDQFGNQDSCSTSITVQDLTNNCGGSFVFSGKITTPDNEGILNAAVEFADNSGYMQTVLTDTNGDYVLPNIPSNNDPILTPLKDNSLLNGVTTFDIVILQKHILFVDRFDDPYTWIAADVNKSGSVTISDGVAMKKAILFIDDSFPNNTSWRFIDKNFVFPNPDNPLEAPFHETISTLGNNFSDLDFYGIKIGDLNGNANPQDLMDSDDRNFTGQTHFKIRNQTFKKGETVVVPFDLNDNLSGYQFTLEFDPETLRFSEIISGFSDENDFGFKFIQDGYLTSSWIAPGGFEIENKTAFALVFVAKREGQLSEILKLNSKYTSAEAYSNDLEIQKINLLFENKNTKADALILFQNQPNPFSDKTTVRFFLPEKSKVRFLVYSVAGQMIFESKKMFDKGMNEVEISGASLPSDGIYFYQIRVGNQIRTGKAVLVRK